MDDLEPSKTRKSLSARRAWIEIQTEHQRADHSGVALRKESVDRNNGIRYDNYNLHWSLSARRAWIEIGRGNTMNIDVTGRSPQGERG